MNLPYTPITGAEIAKLRTALPAMAFGLAKLLAASNPATLPTAPALSATIRRAAK